MKIKEWAEEDRPREKMLLKGIASLSDAELLAILIGSGNSRETAVQLSQRILNSVNNNLNALGKLSVKELMFKFKGIGKVKAITINAALELGKRRGNSDPVQRPVIPSIFKIMPAEIVANCFNRDSQFISNTVSTSVRQAVFQSAKFIKCNSFCHGFLILKVNYFV